MAKVYCTGQLRVKSYCQVMSMSEKTKYFVTFGFIFKMHEVKLKNRTKKHTNKP